MRTDESGQPCPGTLFEYRDLCKAIGGPSCPAVKFLEKKIAENGGEDDEVIQADSQMRLLLMPMLFGEDNPEGMHLAEADVCMGCSTDRVSGECPNPECTWGKNKETD